MPPWEEESDPFIKKLPSSSWILSVDEVGRGSAFGPLSVGGIFWRKKDLKRIPLFIKEKVQDSKLLSPLKREEIFKECSSLFLWKVVHIGSGYVVKNSLEQAFFYALKKLLRFSKVSYLLIDGKYSLPMRKEFLISYRSIPKGDRSYLTIALAGIFAKVERDYLLSSSNRWGARYRVEKHKGYLTREHKEKIALYGLSPYHRENYRWRSL